MKASNVVVSVIVLTHNHEKYIRQALNSILEQQTTFCYEILVGDDASTDQTSDIVQEFARSYPQIIRPFIREKNLGATKNLYDLFQHAQGKYIAGCEGDDYWCDPHKLQKQIDFLESHSDYSACTHNCLIVDENGAAMSEQTLPWVCKKEHYTMRDFRGIYLSGQPATLVHRNFFLNASHDYSIIYKANPLIADRTVTLILTAFGPIYHFPDFMSCYRRNTSADAANVTARMFQNNKNVNQMQYELTCKLERYMEEEFGIVVHFTGFKLRQRIKGWIKQTLIFNHRKVFR